MMRGTDVKAYLQELHDNKPEFDEILPRFDKEPDPWKNIASHILTPFQG